MKITVELSDAQVKGIKKYLKAVDDIPKPNKDDVAREIRGIVHSCLQAPQCAVADYIQEFEKPQ